MRNITSMELVKEMRLGWNLGNALDADPNETGWGNPMTTPSMMDAVQAAGFNTVRIPVTWHHHMGSGPDFTIDPTWLDRVEEVVRYVLTRGLYAIVNTHHDAWVSVMPNADETAITERLVKLWTQIAARFKDEDEHLVFETLNEPRTTDDTQWNGGTIAARTLLNNYNLAAVNAIRATGGNNTLRHLMIPTHAASASTTCINELTIPNDDPNIIVSLHTYFPNDLSFGGACTWGSTEEKTAMTTELDRIANLLPKRGRAVVIGEWETVHQDNTAVRVDHAKTYAKAVVARGMLPIWWDNGISAIGTDGFALLDRKSDPPNWVFPEIATALVAGADEGSTLAT
jgi:endoglucanase